MVVRCCSFRSPWLKSGVALAAPLLAICLITRGVAAENSRHVVRPGDTVPRLSWQYKIRAERIRAANGLRSDALTPGSTIVIPGPEGEPESGSAARPTRSNTAAPRPEPSVTTPAAPIRTAVSVDRRALPTETPPPRRGTSSPRIEPGPLPESENAVVEPPAATRAARPAPRATPAPAPVPAARVTPLPPPVPGPLPGPRNEPPLGALPVTPTAKLGPGLSRELPRVPEERAERPGTRGTPEAEPAPDAPPSNEAPRKSEARDPNDTPGQALIKAARRLSREGIRYNGSWTPPGERSAWVMDCSNTARWLYKSALGIELPRTASDQYLAFERAGKLRKAPRGWFSKDVNRKKLDRDLRTGDLLFWENTYKPVRNPDITHVMVFLGNDEQGHYMMAGSEGAKGVNIYTFDPDKKKGGYSTFLGLFKHHGKFVAYARGLAGK